MGLIAQQCFKTCCIITIFFSSSLCRQLGEAPKEAGIKTHDQCLLLILTALFLIALKRRRQFIAVARIRKSQQSVDPCHCLGRAHTPGITRGTPTTIKSTNWAAKRKSTIKRCKSFPVPHLRIVLTERTVLRTPNLLEDSLRCKARRTPEKPEQILADRFGKRPLPSSDMLIFR